MTVRTGSSAPRGRGEEGEQSLDESSFTDARRRISQTVRFLASDRGRLFAMLHEPALAPARGAILICSGVHADLASNYRKEVLLSRALAERGFASMRFQYLGTGNSDGEGANLTFDSMLEDCRIAFDELRKLTGLAPIAIVATRLGALAAAALAREHPGVGLAFWEPAIEGRQYFSEVGRVLRAQRLGSGSDQADPPERPPADPLEDLLEDQERVDVLGYPLDRALFRSAADRSLLDGLGEGTRRVLIVQIGPTRKLRRTSVNLGEHLERQGCDVELHAVMGEEPWWFTSAGWVPVESRPSTADLLEVTVEWFSRLAPELSL